MNPRKVKFVNRRKGLWEKDKHCRKCGIETILPEQMMEMYSVQTEQDRMEFSSIVKIEDRDVMATIQHLYNRQHPLRRTRPMNQEARYELWCWKCNNEDASQISLIILTQRAKDDA